MSQAKVDKYKQDKANRQQIMKKEKRELFLWRTGAYAVCIAAVAWIGFSAYSRFNVPEPKSYAVTTDAVDDYLSGLDAETE